jgi:hypothetical protein
MRIGETNLCVSGTLLATRNGKPDDIMQKEVQRKLNSTTSFSMGQDRKIQEVDQGFTSLLK